MGFIETMFSDKGLIRAGLFLLKKNDAITFVKEAQKRNIVIYGIDGFYITSSKTQPSLQDSIDFALYTTVDNLYDFAVHFLEERTDELYFEIIYDD